MKYKTEISGLELFDATEENLEDILFLIHQIAEYEKMSQEVVASIDSLRESLFVRKRAFVILAKYQGKIVGYMLYFYNYSTFVGRENIYLEDLFLLEEYRHLGIGKALFKVLAGIALDEGCKRIDWVCLHWNEPSLRFYQAIQASRHDEWVLHRLEEEGIALLAK
ncbi:MAG: GNAT family N-acetyltransferase [Anaeroplasmataceae bacterium]|nr:GNAT family N-acetyltransferase [Anaeroplasmataceae bacterium]